MSFILVEETIHHISEAQSFICLFPSVLVPQTCYINQSLER